MTVGTRHIVLRYLVHKSGTHRTRRIISSHLAQQSGRHRVTQETQRVYWSLLLAVADEVLVTNVEVTQKIMSVTDPEEHAWQQWYRPWRWQQTALRTNQLLMQQLEPSLGCLHVCLPRPLYRLGNQTIVEEVPPGSSAILVSSAGTIMRDSELWSLGIVRGT